MLIYDFYPAKGTTKGIISIPHSGEIIPEVFKQYLSSNSRDLAEDVDYRVFELLDFETLSENGISILVGKIHRTCVDLNRPPEAAVLNWKSNSQGTPLVVKEPTNDEVDQLKKQYYAPYFEYLEELINKVDVRPVPVLDFHSMPSRPTPYHLKQNPDQKMSRPQFCISDLKGESCTADFMQYSVEAFGKHGLEAAVNDPYFGGYLTKFINKFETQNIQIETNRSLYMDEVSRELLMDEVKKLVQPVTTAVLSIIQKFS